MKKQDFPCCQFGLTTKQEAAIEKWKQSLHRSKKPYYGRDVQYIFTPTGIGIGLTVRDTKTGKEKDFTDYDVW